MRSEFTRKTKAQAFARCGGLCEGCGRRLIPGDFQYDHIREANDEGCNDLSNCQCLCSACHKPKTKVYVQETRKHERARDKHIGAMQPKTKMRGRPRRLPKNPASDPLTKVCNRF